MTWTNSVVLIVPAADRDAVNALLNELGYTGDNLSIPVGGTLDMKPTHYTCHFWADEELKALAGKIMAREDISEKLTTIPKKTADELISRTVSLAPAEPVEPSRYLDEELAKLALSRKSGTIEAEPIGVRQ